MDLTSTMLTAILGEAERIAADAHALLAPMGQARTQLRQRLLDDGRIVPIGEHAPATSIAAVDGGCVREHLYAADLLVAVVASAEGMNSTGGTLQHDSWAQIVGHHSDNGKVLDAAMQSRELVVLDRLDHGFRILDGSTTSPIIAITHALNLRSPGAQDMVLDLITDEVLGAIYNLGSPEHRSHPGRVVALPKSDSSVIYVDQFHRRYGLSVPGGDRFMAAQILQPGEMLYPRAAQEHQNLASVPKDADDDIINKARALAGAIGPIQKAARENRLVVTYLKPTTADTVIKAEILLNAGPLSEDPAAGDAAPLLEAQTVAKTLSDETPGPHMQEPFAQYAVDLAAKSVSSAAKALNESMLTHLPADADSYLSLLARSYRTQTTRTAPMHARPGR